MMMLDGMDGIDGMDQDAANEGNGGMTGQNGGGGHRNGKKSSITIGVQSDTLSFQGTVPMTWDICENWSFEKSAKYQYRLSLLRPAIRAISKSQIIRIHFNEQSAVQIAHVFPFNGVDAENAPQTHGWIEFIVLPQDTDFIDDDSDDD